MKKSVISVIGISRIACIVMAIVFVFSTAVVFAEPDEKGASATPAPISADIASGDRVSTDPLHLKESFPFENDDHVPVDTVGIKLFFDGDVTAESVRDINNGKGMFEFSGDKKESIETKAYFDKKDPGYILVTASKKDDKDKDISLNPNSKYKLTISGKLTSADGRALGEDRVINFKTVDTSGNSKVYMLLMVLMVAGMIGMTFISNKRKAKAKAEAENMKAINPYKLAKDKGITVAEAIAIVEKDKQKREKRLKAAGIDPASLPAPKEEAPRGQRVKGPRPVSAGGSSYKSGRVEAKAKAAAAKRAAGTTNPKSKKGKHTTGKKK